VSSREVEKRKSKREDTITETNTCVKQSVQRVGACAKPKKESKREGEIERWREGDANIYINIYKYIYKEREREREREREPNKQTTLKETNKLTRALFCTGPETQQLGSHR